MRWLLGFLLVAVIGLAVVNDAEGRIFRRRGYYPSCKICGKGHYWKHHCHKCKKPHCHSKHCKSDHHCHHHNQASEAGWDWRKRDHVVNNWDPRTGKRQKIRQGTAFNPAPEPKPIVEVAEKR